MIFIVGPFGDRLVLLIPVDVTRCADDGNEQEKCRFRIKAKCESCTAKQELDFFELKPRSQGPSGNGKISSDERNVQSELKRDFLFDFPIPIRFTFGAILAAQRVVPAMLKTIALSPLYGRFLHRLAP
ncbi:MAG: hypothetical protein WB580_04430 [Candidatus Binataceae bacterium]